MAKLEYIDALDSKFRAVKGANGAVNVNVSSAVAGTSTVTGNVAGGAADSGNPVKIGGKYNLVLPTFADGQRADLQLSSTGRLMIGFTAPAAGIDGISNTLAFAAASEDPRNGSRLLTVAHFLFNGATWDRVTKATGTSRIASAAATTNGTSAKATSGTVYTVDAYNTTAAVKYLKLYNKATAPTVGTDTPVRTIALKPNDRTLITFPTGYYFPTGIAYALTGAAADADTTALAAGDVVGLNVDYS